MMHDFSCTYIKNNFKLNRSNTKVMGKNYNRVDL